jgi:[acyl-carrier-protein] S-malonyltransferase
MKKTAFIFPGQGAQYVGMGKEIAEKYEASMNIFDKASDALGFDVKEMVFNGDDETLKITENTQPAIFTASIACMQPLLENGIVPAITAGLSLGEYAAHIASGSLCFEDTVKLVKLRGKYMQEAVPVGVGTMAAIIGLSNEDVIEACKVAGSEGTVEPANFNCPGQVVVAGEVKAVEKLVEICKEKGAKRALVLPVSAPFHSSMLSSAGEKLEKELENVEVKDMNIPVVTNVTGDIIKNKDDIKDLLVKQVSSPVLWEKCMRKMVDEGIETFVEIGPGKVLNGFARKIDRSITVMNVEDLASLEKVLDALK